MYIKSYVLIFFLLSMVFSYKNVTISEEDKIMALSDETSNQVIFYIDLEDGVPTNYIYFTIIRESEKMSYKYQYYFCDSNSESEYLINTKITATPKNSATTNLNFKIKKSGVEKKYIGVIVISDNYITETIKCKKRRNQESLETAILVLIIIICSVIFLVILIISIYCCCQCYKTAQRRKADTAMLAVSASNMNYQNKLNAQQQMYAQQMYVQQQMYGQPMYSQQMYIQQPIYSQQQMIQNPVIYQQNQQFNQGVMNENNNQHIGGKSINENTPIINKVWYICLYQFEIIFLKIINNSNITYILFLLISIKLNK